MKAFAFALTFLASVSAFAYPAVGDKASFTGSMRTPQGQSVAIAADVGLVKFNKSADTFTRYARIAIGTDVQEGNEEVAAADLLSKDLVLQLIQSCASQGGRNETITVPAGSFATCAFPVEDQQATGTLWIADVPFGLAKQISVDKQNGVTSTLELRAFTHGR